MESENRDIQGRDGDSPPLSWAILLARWTQFARSAAALPSEGEGQNWRESVAPIIGLQAVTMALGELHLLEWADRPLAIDMAEVLVRRHASELHVAWRGVEMPTRIMELVEEALGAVARAGSVGIEWRWEGDGPLIVPDLTEWGRALLESGFEGQAFAAAPGTILFTGEPGAFARPAQAGAPAPLGDLRPHEGTARQIFRRIEPDGDVVDVIAPFEAPLAPGRPLLALLVDGRRLLPLSSGAEAARWLAAQRAALGRRPARIRFECGE